MIHYIKIGCLFQTFYNFKIVFNVYIMYLPLQIKVYTIAIHKSTTI